MLLNRGQLKCGRGRALSREKQHESRGNRASSKTQNGHLSASLSGVISCLSAIEALRVNLWQPRADAGAVMAASGNAHLAQGSCLVSQQREGQPPLAGKLAVRLWAVAADAKHGRASIDEGLVVVPELASLLMTGVS